MKRFIAIILAGLLCIQSIPYVWAAPAPLIDPCLLMHTKYACDAHKRWGKTSAQAWKAYNNAIYSTETSPYWKESPSRLYARYKSIAEDIKNLWDANPRYIDAKLGRAFGIVLVIELLVTTAFIGGELIAPALESGGYTMAAGTARAVSNTPKIIRTTGETARTLSAASIKQGVRTLIARMKTGKFWGDLGITFGIMVADGLLTESAFFVFENLEADETAYISEVKTDIQAVKTRDLLSEAINPSLTEQQKKDLEENKDDIYALKKELENSFKAALDKQGWRDDDPNKRFQHKEAVVTLHALEFIRAEMSNIDDPWRYEMAAVDFGQIFYTETSSVSLALEADNRPAIRQNFINVERERRRQAQLELSRSRGLVGSIKYVIKKVKEGR